MMPGPPGYVLTEARRLIHRLLHLVGDDATVLEIGANDGMHTRLFQEEFQHPDFRIHCFEPDPRAAARFRTSIHPTDPRCRLEELALTSYDGEGVFHQSGGKSPQSWLEDWDLSGSLRPPTGHLQMSPWVTFDRQIQVPVRRLDTWLEEHPEVGTIDLVWMDAQGGEGDVILGAPFAFQHRIVYLYTEAYERELYAGQAVRSRLLELLPNFEVVEVQNENVLLRNKQPCQAGPETWPQRYARLRSAPTDISAHFSVLEDLAAQCRHVTELGMREGVSTTALYAGLSRQTDGSLRQLLSYDCAPCRDQLAFARFARESGYPAFAYRKADVLAERLAPTDLLFIDTNHNYWQLKAELACHAAQARRWIVLHDTTTFGQTGDDGGAGLWPAVEEFLQLGTFRLQQRLTDQNGLTILERIA